MTSAVVVVSATNVSAAIVQANSIEIDEDSLPILCWLSCAVGLLFGVCVLLLREADESLSRFEGSRVAVGVSWVTVCVAGWVVVGVVVAVGVRVPAVGVDVGRRGLVMEPLCSVWVAFGVAVRVAVGVRVPVVKVGVRVPVVKVGVGRRGLVVEPLCGV